MFLAIRQDRIYPAAFGKSADESHLHARDTCGDVGIHYTGTPTPSSDIRILTEEMMLRVGGASLGIAESPVLWKSRHKHYGGHW